MKLCLKAFHEVLLSDLPQACWASGTTANSSSTLWILDFSFALVFCCGLNLSPVNPPPCRLSSFLTISGQLVAIVKKKQMFFFLYKLQDHTSSLDGLRRPFAFCSNISPSHLSSPLPQPHIIVFLLFSAICLPDTVISLWNYCSFISCSNTSNLPRCFSHCVGKQGGS